MAQRIVAKGRKVAKKEKRRRNLRDRILSDLLYTRPDGTFEALRFVALHSGFPNDRIRKRSWSILLNCEIQDTSPPNISDLICPHDDTDQIERDVDRSLYTIPTARGERHDKRRALSRIMNAVVSSDPSLRYYQGYHDIATVFLLLCGERQAFLLVDALSHAHIRACLHPDLAPVVEVLELLLPLIAYLDEELHEHIQDSEVQPYFALSWILTWYAHDFEHSERLRRLFDFFIVCHPMMPLYFAAVAVCHVTVRRRLLSMEREYSSVHTFLMNLFSSKTAIFTHPSFPFESLIYDSRCLFAVLSPDALFELGGKPLARSQYRTISYPWMAFSVFPPTPSPALSVFVDSPVHAMQSRIHLRRQNQLEFGNAWGELPDEIEPLATTMRQPESVSWIWWSVLAIVAVLLGVLATHWYSALM